MRTILRIFIAALFCAVLPGALLAQNANARQVQQLVVDGIKAKQQGNLQEAETRFKKALRLAETRLGKNDEGTGVCLNNLGEVYADQNRHKDAIPLFKRALSILEALRKTESEEYAQTLENLSTVYMVADQMKEAQGLLEKALTVREKLFGKGKYLTCPALVKLALYHRLNNELDRSVEYFEQVIAIKEKVDADSELIEPRIVLGKIYMEKKEYDKAERQFKEALSAARGMHMTNQNALRASERTFGQRVPAEMQKRYTPHMWIATTDLGVLYQIRGDYREAEKNLKEALGMADVIFGKNGPPYAKSLMNYAAILKVTEKTAEARSHAEQALKIFKADPGAAGREIQATQAFLDEL